MPKANRKCSRCRTSGHTKRTCLVPLKSRRAAPPVIVRVTPGALSSPHVVNLRRESSAPFPKTPIFQEQKSAALEKSEILDLAELIRAANARSERQWVQKMHTLADRLTRQRRALLRQPVLPHTSLLVRGLFGGAKPIEWHKIKESVNRLRPRLSLGLRPQSFRRATDLSRHIRRLVTAAVAIVLVAGLPFPAVGYYQKLKGVNGLVVEESTAGFLALQAATVAALTSNITQAQEDLNEALQLFAAANSLLDKDYRLLISIAEWLPVVGDRVESRQHLLVAGHHLALGNTYLVKGVVESEQAAELPFTDRVEILERHLKSAEPQYAEALAGLNQVQPQAIPAAYQKPFADFKLLFAAFVNDLRDLADLAGVVRSVLGDDSFRRYLVVFQNHHELRPTGGFVGSFAIVDVQKGKLVNVEVPAGGSYDLQGQLTAFLKPPMPLQLANARWEFQDANWFPDFSASAEKLAWFYRAARGTTVDGVIAVNASVLERLLRVVGPVEAKEYDLVLAHDTALSELEQEVEFGENKKINQPKAVIAELLGEMLALLTKASATDLMRLLTEVHSAAEEKEIQIALRDDSAQATLRQFGWTGEVWPTPAAHDYLLVVHSNIQGQKSDAKIEQTIEHQAHVQSDGSIVDTVVIRREHKGRPGESLYGGPNISYVRVYVPEGAELLDAGGFTYPPEEAFHTPEDWYEEDQTLAREEKEVATHIQTGTRITEEFGKTAFGNWVVTLPGEASEVFFTYRLPFSVPLREGTNGERSREWWSALLQADKPRILSPYRLLLQKQSGVNSQFSLRVIYQPGWTPVWRSDAAIDLALNGAVYKTVLKSDQVVGVVFEHDP